MKQRTSPRRGRKKTDCSAKSHARVSVLARFNAHAAGIDVGASDHWVAVPADRDAQPVRRFGTFTADLHAIAQWLEQCGIQTVVMESTGIYWIRGSAKNSVHVQHNMSAVMCSTESCGVRGANVYETNLSWHDSST